MDLILTTDETAYEHICLGSDDPEPVVATRIDTAISQNRRSFRLTITIFNGEYLGVRTTRHSGPEVFHWMPITFVDPRPSLKLGMSGKLRVAALTGIGILVAAILLVMIGERETELAAIMMSVTVPALIGISVSTVRRHREYVFQTRHGRSELFRLAQHLADSSNVRQFIKKIEQYIDNNKESITFSRQQLLSEEMKQHQRLADEGLFSKAQFKIARRLILDAHDE